MSILKKTSTIFLISLASIFFVSCSSKNENINEIAVTECTIAGAKAPLWACGNYSEESRFVAVGSAPMSKLGHDFTRREALANARTNLVNDIELEVKNKVESYMNSTGLKESESIERVVTMVSRQTSSKVLKESKQISFWENPKDNFLYILVAIPKVNIEKAINSEVEKALNSLDKI
ncbi:hypothetical protein CRU87_07095 [Aliarcobacter trophiarum LMG 25534]|uniref:LPP20 family lipoprotein n=1 Tax=Aliarcobacter trophiarum LMG 25534 TaxID=1032241 RepID=A0AAD0VMD5_9BACT|nr:LPP20 family lipoprotein [Aliarcobacter trophiarum]AXK49099.1 LPP20 family lipoprotein [Aliarcobacter trophiarum LMG 25534]RXJ90987.1 hypothetical protein CRU87_07095 [Aliarcobacter trophiarum LMG 25534]